MASTVSRPSVTTSASNLTTATDGDSRLWADGFASGFAVRVPVGGTTVTIGFSSAVTTSNGWDVLAGESLSLNLREFDAVWAISTGTQIVQVIRTDV